VQWRGDDFSAIGGTPVKDPFASGALFPNNTIPASRLNPAVLKLQNLYWPTHDHRFSDKWFLFGRMTWKTATVNNVVDRNLPTLGLRHQDWLNRGAAVSSTYSIRPNLLNETR
jgi:hypothetical protein